LIFQEKGTGVSPLPRKKLSAVASTIAGRGVGGFTSEMVTRLARSRATPKESKPGPRLAVVPGTETVTESEFFRNRFFAAVLMENLWSSLGQISE
jgi:hypothetical protein